MSYAGTRLLVLAWGLTAIHAADFSADIRPVLEASCWKCHGGAIQLSKLDLRTRESALKGGVRGAAIVPGQAAEGGLSRVVGGLKSPAMPMDGKITAAQIEAIREWIDQGAPWAAEAPAASSDTSSLEEFKLPP